MKYALQIKAMNPDQLKKLEQSRFELVQSDMDAWKFLLEFHRITDEDIKIILTYGKKLKEMASNFPAEVWKKMVESADDARRAILKVYSYETFCYRALNQANQRRDESAIKTLGPFSYLLSRTL